MLRENKGIFYKDLPIDCLRKQPSSVLTTHAHSDHYMPSNTLLSSKETASLLQIPHIPPKSKEIKIQSFNSGHILGSKQYLLDNTLLITGDIKTKPSLTAQEIQPVNADTLLIESTFGLPQYKFPDREKIYSDIQSFCSKNKNKIILFGAYSLGKAQELIKILNNYCSLTPSVHEKIFSYSQIYNKYNSKLSFNPFKEKSNIYILPQQLLNRDFLFILKNKFSKPIVPATASGWGQRYPSQHNFLLSDHADFYDLLDYIKQVEPKFVYTHHGYSYEFARYIRSRLNIPALPISRKQEVLLSYV